MLSTDLIPICRLRMRRSHGWLYGMIMKLKMTMQMIAQRMPMTRAGSFTAALLPIRPGMSICPRVVPMAPFDAYARIYSQLKFGQLAEINLLR
jgi:phosphodiesterase/alkaline phosphatase D-like protein